MSIYTFALQADTAYRMAATCSPCMGKEAVRYYLNGVCLQFEAGKINAVATDGHRLAWYKMEPSGTFEGKGLNAIIPREAVESLLTISRKEGHFIIFTVNQKNLSLTIKDGETVSNFKLVDGTYPGWRHLWDKAAKDAHREPTAFFNTHYLADIAKAVKNVNGKKHTRIGLVFSRTNPQQEGVIIATPDTNAHYLLMPMK